MLYVSTQIVDAARSSVAKTLNREHVIQGLVVRFRDGPFTLAAVVRFEFVRCSLRGWVGGADTGSNGSRRVLAM